ncbi:Tail fiber protein [Citrobacter freundii]|uniref:gp53-like domain-containing protein n=1 Tax=Citrobacter freundii TaxID=546 RepID=UPI003B237D84
MYHVDNSTGVPVMPLPSPITSETELFFTEGGNGVPPTYPGPDWFNAIQSELLNIIRAAGLDPDKMDNTQILAALKKLFLSRSNPFGDIKTDGAAAIATALSNLGLGNLGSASGRDVGNTQPFYIPDMSYFPLTGKGSDNLLAKLPNGLIIQIFRRRLANLTSIGMPTTIPVTYPTPFPTNIWGVFCTKATYAQIVTSCESATATGFDAVTCLTSGTSPGSNLSDVYFLAIGY